MTTESCSTAGSGWSFLRLVGGCRISRNFDAVAGGLLSHGSRRLLHFLRLSGLRSRVRRCGRCGRNKLQHANHQLVTRVTAHWIVFARACKFRESELSDTVNTTSCWVGDIFNSINLKHMNESSVKEMNQHQLTIQTWLKLQNESQTEHLGQKWWLHNKCLLRSSTWKLFDDNLLTSTFSNSVGK